MDLKVIIVIKDELHNAPRPLRFYSHCKSQNYSINVACCPSKAHEQTPLRPIAEISNIKLGKYQRDIINLCRTLLPLDSIKNKINEVLYDLHALKELLRKQQFDIIYVADLHMLPMIVTQKKQAKVVFDAREYYPLQYEDNFNFRLLEKQECIRILRQTLFFCDKVLTVSPGLADAYQKNFGIIPELVFSLPNYQQELISNTTDETIKILYHGMANRNRKIENYVNLLEFLTIDAELHLYLVGDTAYINELENCARGKSKVFFHKPVAFKDIINTVNQYDIGICYYEPTSFNLRHCLPNKFFEYIQARLVLAIGPSPDMAEIVGKYKCGIISKDFTIQALAHELNLMTRTKINFLKGNSDIAAREFCFEREENKFSCIIRNLTSL
jgi:hypothetical protein